MILIPAAGDGSRFREAGYVVEKHMIPLGGVPMVHLVAAQCERAMGNGSAVIATKEAVGTTRGAVETVMRGAHGCPSMEELLVANCDQLIRFPEGDWKRGDGVIFTFRSSNPAHSYVTTVADLITDIVEKEVVSDRAVSGVYWFAESSLLLDQCDVILHDAPMGSGELYLSRAIRRVVARGAELYACDVPTAILGTPEDFQRAEVMLDLARYL